MGDFGDGLRGTSCRAGDDEFPRRLQTAVEIDRTHQRFVAVGQEIARHRGFAVDVHAPAQKQVIAQVDRATDAGAGPPADDGRLDLGQVALLELGEADVELFAADDAEHGVAEELEALVGGQPAVLVGIATVRQRDGQQFVGQVDTVDRTSSTALTLST